VPPVAVAAGLCHNRLHEAFWMKTIARLLAVLLDGARGTGYGWLPAGSLCRYRPGNLRSDYRTDYVLMVAQSYASSQDLQTAQVRLASLGPQPAADLVTQGLTYAVDHEFSRYDLDTLNLLAIALREAAPTAEIQSP
jgi:hypothetical protein